MEKARASSPEKPEVGDHPEDRSHLLPRLLVGTASQILGRIGEDDPLRLYELGAWHKRQRFLLLDADRVFEGLVPRVAYVGAQTQPSELGRAWLIRQMDHVLDQLIEAEREEERESPFDCDPEDPRYLLLRSMFVEGRWARAASLAFNTLPERARRAFFHLMLERRTVEDTLALRLWTEEELMRDCWRAIGSLGLHDANCRPNPDWQLRP